MRRFWRAVEWVADRLDTLTEAFWIWARDKAERITDDDDEGGTAMAIVSGLNPSINIHFTSPFGPGPSGKPKLPAKPEPAARTSTKPIRAYRQWALRFDGLEPYLNSTVVDQRWDGPILRSDHKPHFHTQPGNTNQLGHGIYAFPLVCAEMERTQTMAGAVQAYAAQMMWGASAASPTRDAHAEGEVELMGRVIRHEHGYRAEAVRIVRLFIRDLPGHYDREDVIRRMEARYQCEVSMMPLYDPERLRASQPEDEAKPDRTDAPNEPAGFSTGFLQSSFPVIRPAPQIKLIGGP